MTVLGILRMVLKKKYARIKTAHIDPWIETRKLDPKSELRKMVNLEEMANPDFQEGWRAFINGLFPTDNPHKELRSERWAAWDSGWNGARKAWKSGWSMGQMSDPFGTSNERVVGEESTDADDKGKWTPKRLKEIVDRIGTFMPGLGLILTEKHIVVTPESEIVYYDGFMPWKGLDDISCRLRAYKPKHKKENLEEKENLQDGLRICRTGQQPV
jgi:hypothetical protein